MAGEIEAYPMIAGEVQEASTTEKGTRLVLTAGMMIHSQVPAEGAGHFAVNEGYPFTIRINSLEWWVGNLPQYGFASGILTLY